MNWRKLYYDLRKKGIVTGGGGSGGGSSSSVGIQYGPNPETVEYIDGGGDNLNTFFQDVFTEFTFHDVVTVLNDAQFENSSYTYIALPKTVTVTGSLTLNNCPDLVIFLVPLLQTTDSLVLSDTPSLTTLNIDSLTEILGGNDLDFSNCGLVTFSAPLATDLGNGITNLENSSILHFLTPKLADSSILDTIMAGGGANLQTLDYGIVNYTGLDFENLVNLQTLRMDLLETCDAISDLALTQISTLTLPSLQSTTFGITSDGTVANLVSVNLVSFVSSPIDIRDCPLFTTINVPQWLPSNGDSVVFTGNALTTESINHILARCVAAGVTTCNIELQDGTNAAPTGQGLIDKAALITAGNTVTTN